MGVLREIEIAMRRLSRRAASRSARALGAIVRRVVLVPRVGTEAAP